MSQLVLSMSKISKRYSHFELRGIDLEIQEGMTIGMAGPNGSGKSTLMRIILGLVHQDAGSVLVFGRSMPAKQAEVKQQVGFVSDDLRLHRSATLRWHADVVRSLCFRWDEARARHLAERYQLPWDQPAGGFSRGQVTKALLVLALARRPRLLLLDEPTAALDAPSREELLGELARLVRTDGLAILVSSHNAGDLEGHVDGYLHLPKGQMESIRRPDPEYTKTYEETVAVSP